MSHPLPDDLSEALRIERARVDRLIEAVAFPLRTVDASPDAGLNER